MSIRTNYFKRALFPFQIEPGWHRQQSEASQLPCYIQANPTQSPENFPELRKPQIFSCFCSKPEQRLCLRTISLSWQQRFQSRGQLLPQAHPRVRQILENRWTFAKQKAARPPGQRFCQKMEWFRCPPPLNFKAPCNLLRNYKSLLGDQRRSPNDRWDVILCNSISKLLLDHIEVVDIGLVVLAVVDLHNLRRDHLSRGIITLDVIMITGSRAL